MALTTLVAAPCEASGVVVSKKMEHLRSSAGFETGAWVDVCSGSLPSLCIVASLSEVIHLVCDGTGTHLELESKFCTCLVLS